MRESEYGGSNLLLEMWRFPWRRCSTSRSYFRSSVGCASPLRRFLDSVGAVLGRMNCVAGVAARMPGEGTRLVAVIVGAALGLLASWIYEAAMESSSLQATLGKMIFGMKVTDLNRNRISFARATGRHFAKYLSSMILFIGYIMAGFTERKQALHDIIASTVVVRR